MTTQLLKTMLLAVVTFAIATTDADAGELRNLATQTREVPSLEWHILKLNVLYMQQYNYVSKPTFMGLSYDEKSETVTLTFEIRQPFLNCYRSKEAVIECLELACAGKRYLLHDLDPSLDRTWEKWLKIRFRQQGGGDGRDIATYEHGKLTVRLADFLTPPQVPEDSRSSTVRIRKDLNDGN